MLNKHTAVGMFSGWWVSLTWFWEPEGGAGAPGTGLPGPWEVKGREEVR